MADTSMLKDIKLIYSVHSRLDYSNLDEVRIVQDNLIRKNIFESDMGIDYIDKLSDIVKKADVGRCIFCKQIYSPGTAICPSCEAKLEARYGLKGRKRDNVTEESAPTNNALNEDAGGSAEPDMADLDLAAMMDAVADSNPAPVNTPMFSENDPEPAGREDGPGSFMESLAAMAKDQDVSEIAKKAGKKAKDATDKSVRKFAKKVNELAGGDGEVELRFRDFFSDVFKKHTSGEAEEIFICGTSFTTPAESEISSNWPHPWLYSRVLLILFAAFYILILCWTGFQNTNVIPDIIFIGSAIMPVSVLIFLFEINAPRNISLITVLKVFFVGGASSLVVTLLIFSIAPVGELDYIGALLVGIIEEVGKAVIVVIVAMKTPKCKYIFNGILLGGSVGAGFAAFESAGYAFNAYLHSNGYEAAYSNMLHSVYLRGLLSPGGHVAWAAITGAAIMIALNGGSVNLEFIKDKRFIALFLMAVIMHALWDCPLVLLGIPLLKQIILIAAAWIILVVLINNALKEINTLKN